MFAKYTKIQNLWGATEAWGPPQLDNNNEDVEYVFFDTKHAAIDFRPLEAEYFDDDGSLLDIYEIVLTIRPDNAHLSGWHLLRGITPENAGPRESWPEHRLGDLWTPHPDPAKAPFAWRFVGRADDIITFSTGVNMHPGPMERAINSFTSVRHSLVVGAGRRQPLLLVELVDGLQPSGSGYQQGNGKEVDSGAGPEQQLWEDVIEPQNEKLPMHARIARTHILYFPARSFAWMPKGAVSRRSTEQKLAAEIEEAYRKHGDRWQEGNQRFGSIVHTFDVKVETSEEVVEGAEGTAADVEGRTTE